MNPWKKRIAAALSAALLLSLCLTPAALAAEAPAPDAPAASPAPAGPTDAGSAEPAPAPTPGPAEGGPARPDPPPGVPPEEPDWREAATLAELEDLLFGGMMQSGGQIRVTGDLLVPAGEACMIWPSPPEGAPLVVDLGIHSLRVEGRLTVRGGIQFTGAGGEAGLVQVKPGGSATLIEVLFTVSEPGGCAVRQEEGGTLRYTPHADTVGEICLAPGPEAEAASFAELAALLEDGGFLETGGLIRAGADLTVPADGDYAIRPRDPEGAPLTVELGGHTLAVEGKLTVYGGVEFTGAGGENGLLRVRTGGAADIASAVRFTVTAEGGCALWQEEGGILHYEPAPGSAGNIHFAQRPVAEPHSAVSSVLFTPVALVRDGQTLADALPVTVGVRLNRGGAVDRDAQIPVVWDLEPCRAQLDRRERVLLTGSYPDAEAVQAPVCLAAFQNGKPATILNCYGAEGRGTLSAMVQLALARPELGCRFEWSRDGETWLPAGSEESPAEGGFPVFYVTFPQGELPAYPYYLSAVVEDPSGGAGYSDVAVIEEAGVRCGSGGNRGGGTDITDPPGAPAPDPEPPSDPPEQSGGGEAPGGAGGGDGGETPEPGPGPAPEPPGGAQGGGGGEWPAGPTSGPSKGVQDAEPAPEPEPPSGPAVPPPEASAGLETAPDAPDGGAGASGPEPEAPAPSGGGASPGTADPEAAPSPAPGAPDALSVAAGCAAVAATVGAAALYLHPKAGRRIWEALKRLFKP